MKVLRLSWVVVGSILFWSIITFGAQARVVAITADADGTAFFLDDRRAVWGFNRPDQMEGLIRMVGLSDIVEITPFAALRKDGTVFTWDLSSRTVCYGEGLRVVAYTVPHIVSGLSNIVSISGMDRHFLALSKSGEAYQFGRNVVAPRSQLNSCSATLKSDMVPSSDQLINLKNVVSISAGYVTNAALTSDGIVHIWGYAIMKRHWSESREREVGSTVPEEIYVGRSTERIFVTDDYLYALSKSGEVRVWGACIQNSSDQHDIMSGVMLPISQVRSVIASPSSIFSPSGFLRANGQLVLADPPTLKRAGLVTTCTNTRVGLEHFSSSATGAGKWHVADGAVNVGDNQLIVFITESGTIWSASIPRGNEPLTVALSMPKQILETFTW